MPISLVGTGMYSVVANKIPCLCKAYILIDDTKTKSTKEIKQEKVDKDCQVWDYLSLKLRWEF